MVGPKNYSIVEHSQQVGDSKLYAVTHDDPAHRRYGSWGYEYLVSDEEELKDLFSEFECLSTGYFDQSMFDMTSNFHWIFVGRKR